MVRILRLALLMSPLALAGIGCQVGPRLVHECKCFGSDCAREFLGLDYPAGRPESTRQQYVGLPDTMRVEVRID